MTILEDPIMPEKPELVGPSFLPAMAAVALTHSSTKTFQPLQPRNETKCYMVSLRCNS